MSTLGDRKTQMKSYGEVDVSFKRDSWTVRLHAIVVKDLAADIFGGTVFQDENDIILRQKKKQITVHGKHTVFSTDLSLPLPQTRPTTNNVNVTTLASANVIYPNTPLIVQLDPSKYLEGDTVIVEPRLENNNKMWPSPRVCSVNQGTCEILNDTDEPVIIGKDVHLISIKPTVPCPAESNTVHSPVLPRAGLVSYHWKGPADSLEGRAVLELETKQQPSGNKNLEFITVNSAKITDQLSDRIKTIHQDCKDVFDSNLSEGYNGAAGRHIVDLHWADSNRPEANKVQSHRWSNKRDDILQKKIDQLTQQGVLIIPQEANTQIKFVSNCFLQKKGRATHKDLDQCTMDELRFLVDFTRLNSFLCKTPAKAQSPQEIFQFIGDNPWIIIADMYNSYFQMIMARRAYPYLGIMSPHKGMRIVARAGQGLLNSDSELKELVAKVLGEEIAQGKCKVVADDLVIGGPTKDIAIDNYQAVLTKLSQSNIKLTPEKTTIFPDEATIHGWLLKGGLLYPSPHRKLALTKTKPEDLTTSSHFRSWIGTFKTFLPAMSGCSDLLDCFDVALAGKPPKTPIQWTEEMKRNFSLLKDRAENDIHALAIPSTNERLILLPDATVKSPGIGFVLMVKRDKFYPVLFLSFKLKQYHQLWFPCEQEALGAAVAVEQSSYYISQSKHPTVVAVDSKPVYEAYQLMKAGKFSSSSRMQSFLHCINRYNIVVQHISGKMRANIPPDYLSRNPAECTNPDKCQLCKYVEEKSTAILCHSMVRQDIHMVSECEFQPGSVIPTVLNTMKLEDLLITDNKPPFASRQVWLSLQQDDPECRVAVKHMTSGQPFQNKNPTHRVAKVYVRDARLAKPDNLLVVPQQIPYQSKMRERIVIPKSFVKAIVVQLHYELRCPSEYQLNQVFNRYFYAIGSRQVISQVHQECHQCQARKQIKDEKITFHHVSDPEHPGSVFNADVIKRSKQNIFVARDLFSCLTIATIAESEQTKDMKKAIVTTVQPIRHHSAVKIRVDNASAMKSLAKNDDNDLKQLDIVIECGDKLNKNSIASVDRAHQELEAELRKLCPEAEKVTDAILAKAVHLVNSRIRNQGLSALEIHFGREQHTGQNLLLDDKKLAQNQQSLKDKNNESSSRSKYPHNRTQVPAGAKIGDIVYFKHDNEATKHSIRQPYLVTGLGNNSKCYVQKMLHSHSNMPTVIRKDKIAASQEQIYRTQQSRLEQSQFDWTVPDCSVPTYTKYSPSTENKVTRPEWNPIKEYSDDDSSSSEDDDTSSDDHNEDARNDVDDIGENGEQPRDDNDDIGAPGEDNDENDDSIGENDDASEDDDKNHDDNVINDTDDDDDSTVVTDEDRDNNEDGEDEKSGQDDELEQGEGEEVDDVDALEPGDADNYVIHDDAVVQHEPEDAVLQIDHMLERLEQLQPDEQELQPLPQRAAAVRAMQGIRKANRGEPKVIPQIDGAYTPSTSANVSLDADNQHPEDNRGTVQPPVAVEAGPVTSHQNGTDGAAALGGADSLGGDDCDKTDCLRTDDDRHDSASSLEWDPHTSTSELSPDPLEDAFYLHPLDLAYNGQSGADLDRVFNFNNALPLESTPSTGRKSSSSTNRSRKRAKKKKKRLEDKTRRIPLKLFKLWKTRKKSPRRDDDDDGPPSQVV